jgi:hypothetical protein
VDVLVIKPDVTPLGVLLVFPGQGVGEFGSLFGMVTLGPNFVVRTAPQYVRQGYAVAANQGFYGMTEEPVTQAIGDWCAGKAVPEVISNP